MPNNELAPGGRQDQIYTPTPPQLLRFRFYQARAPNPFFFAGCTHIVFSGLPGTEHSLPGTMQKVVPGKYFAPGCSQDRLDPKNKTPGTGLARGEL